MTVRGALLVSIPLFLTAAAGAYDPAPLPTLSRPSPAPTPDTLDPVARRTMQVHFLLATEFYKDGDYASAINEWKEVLKIQPDHALAKEKIKRAREKLGR